MNQSLYAGSVGVGVGGRVRAESGSATSASVRHKIDILGTSLHIVDAYFLHISFSSLSLGILSMITFCLPNTMGASSRHN